MHRSLEIVQLNSILQCNLLMHDALSICVFVVSSDIYLLGPQHRMRALQIILAIDDVVCTQHYKAW